MTAYELFLLLVFGLLLVVTVLLFLPIRRSQDSGRAPAGRSSSAMNRDEERYWWGGVIHYNRDDPDLWVPKRFGLGWTVNFAHPGGRVFLIVLLLLLLLPVLLLLLGVPLTQVGCHSSGCSRAP